jgi:endonuclease YncB( thermonuclease family)
MRKTLSVALVAVSSLVLAAPPKVVDQFSGKVVSVTDGDTLKVLVKDQPITVRLEGIDAPESGQSYGRKAKEALNTLVAGKVVSVRKTGEDQYGRTLGVVLVGDVDVNAKMIEDGWAWHFRKYNDEERLSQVEVAARQAGKGLWADPAPLAPWDFRARQKTPTTPAADAPPMVARYWLNTASGVRHNERCEHFRNTKQGRLCVSTEGKACGKCGG